MVPIQYFGELELVNGSQVPIMFCCDADSREVSVHVLEGPTRCVVTCRTRQQDALTEITPIGGFAMGADGTLMPLSEAHLRDLVGDAIGYLEFESERNATGYWKRGDGTTGKFVLYPSPTANAPLGVETVGSWGEFKSWATRVASGSPVFRGHSKSSYRLQTGLHRQHRSRLDRYSFETIHEFSGHYEAQTNLGIDQNDPMERTRLLGVAQHHGLPTPMLDWTASPYIAAYFAFSGAIEDGVTADPRNSVRIYALDKAFTSEHSPSNFSVFSVEPYIYCLSASARGNPRMYAQQGSFLITNVASLEPYINNFGTKIGKKVLHIVDIPVAAAVEAMADLKYMGLSAASLFPGLDGTCKMLRHQMLLANTRPVLFT